MDNEATGRKARAIALEIKALLWQLAEGALHIKRLDEHAGATVTALAPLVQTTRGLCEKITSMCEEFELEGFKELNGEGEKKNDAIGN
jgi:hypothetical protein